MREVSARFGFDLDLMRPSKTAGGCLCSGGDVKAPSRQAKVPILDEPTAVLTPAGDLDELMTTASAADAGTSIVFITQ